MADKMWLSTCAGPGGKLEASGTGAMRAEVGTHTFIILVWRRLCVLGVDFENLRGWFHDWPLYEDMSRCIGCSAVISYRRCFLLFL